eukprot:TRINITY_DN10304_c0_g2_i1.p1 TRINITY_DN10304_c0_g2~~TRINITY_DN10304_c0_g2_i1.p1  ORF type:complete len:485 (+),score=100.58 TRINITY_DN10304_c0_g2_i1:116-1456(+)
MAGLSVAWVESDGKKYEHSACEVYNERENHGAPWNPAVILCSVPKNSSPMRVALVEQGGSSDDSELIWLKVHQPHQKFVNVMRKFGYIPERFYKQSGGEVFEHDLSICLSPMYGEDREFSFLQWVEYYKLMGVTKVFAYDFIPSGRLKEFVNHYEKEGFLEVINYQNLPSCTKMKELDLSLGNFECKDPEDNEKFDKDSYGYVHYFGQLAAIQDCLLRSVGVSKWTAFVDLDEFLVLKNQRLYKNLTNYLETVLTREMRVPRDEFMGYQFSNFLTKACAVPSEISGVEVSSLSPFEKQLYSLPLHQAREHGRWGYVWCAKNIANPLNVEYMKIHDFFHVSFKRSPLNPRTIKTMIQRNYRSEKFFRGKHDLKGRTSGDLKTAVYYVHPDEVMMFHLKDPLVKPDDGEECQQLYSEQGFHPDRALWDGFGKQLMDALSNTAKQLGLH